MVEETKRISKRSKLYEELERRFVEDNSKEAESKRIEKLREIKASHAPVNKEDLLSHAKKYEEVIRQKKEELRAKRGGLDLLHVAPVPTLVPS